MERTLLEQQGFITMSSLENFRLKNKHKKMCGLNKGEIYNVITQS